jgi:DIS3-like exonuclease 2
MLLANISVATKIQEHFPHIAVLRCHPPPKDELLDRTMDLLQTFDIDIDSSSSLTIQESLKNYKPLVDDSDEYEGDKGRWQVLMSLISKPMQMARYFCTGMEEDLEKYRHYALSVPLYTHFTSPIRRYPDLLVHR